MKVDNDLHFFKGIATIAFISGSLHLLEHGMLIMLHLPDILLVLKICKYVLICKGIVALVVSVLYIASTL